MSLALVKLIKEGDIDGVKRMLDNRTANKPFSMTYAAILLEHALESESPNKKDIFEYIVHYTKYNMSDQDESRYGATFLMKMIKDGCSIDSISLLLKYMKTEEIETINYDDYTALVMTVSEYAKILVYTKLDENEKALTYYRDVIIELLKHGANPRGEYSEQSMIIIVENNIFDLLDVYIDNSKYDIKYDMLRISMIYRNYDFVEYLIGKIKDMDKFTKFNADGKTLLEYAQDLDPPDEDIVELVRLWEFSDKSEN